jgi:hypothetical protein
MFSPCFLLVFSYYFKEKTRRKYDYDKMSVRGWYRGAKWTRREEYKDRTQWPSLKIHGLPQF